MQFVEQIEKEIKDPKIRIASLIGRYYAMDRDKRWDRIAEAYHLFCDGEGELFTKASDAVQKIMIGILPMNSSEPVKSVIKRMVLLKMVMQYFVIIFAPID